MIPFDPATNAHAHLERLHHDAATHRALTARPAPHPALLERARAALRALVRRAPLNPRRHPDRA